MSIIFIVFLLLFLIGLIVTIVVIVSKPPPPIPTKECNASLYTMQNDCPNHSSGEECYCKISSNAVLSCEQLFKPALLKINNICDKIGVDIISTCSSYKQYWHATNITNPATGNTKLRHTAIAIPRCGKRPKEGWPVIMYLEFMLNYGKSDGWGSDYNLGGILPSSDIKDAGRITLQSMLVSLTGLGYAIVMTSEWQGDSYFYADCNSNDPSNICWNQKSNPDLPYLESIFSGIHKNTLVDGEKLNYDRFGIIGYSVGAQMVSRCMNDFPLLKLSDGTPFPKIDAAVMCAGGTLGCYNDTNNLEPCCISPECKNRCNKSGKACVDWCCPSGMSEPNYDNGTLQWIDHPPVLLLQTENDGYADIYAWSKYFNTVSNESKNKVDLYAVISGGYRHGFCASQINPVINFLKKYV